MFIEIADPDATVSRYSGSVAGDTETTLEEIDLFVPIQFQLRIDDHVKAHRNASAFAQLFDAPGALVLFAILNDRKLETEANLRCSQTDSTGLAKSFQHIGDGLLQLRSVNFINAKETRSLP